MVFVLFWVLKPIKNIATLSKEERKLADIRIYEVLHKHDDKAIGFDVSEYQSKIDWESKPIILMKPLSCHLFLFVTTAGKNKIDTRFKENWKGAKERQIIRGAYHYYRPNENSLEQAENFIITVKLQKGFATRFLDIEKLPKSQSIDSLKVGLRRWLKKKVEKHYKKVKPIIYSGRVIIQIS